MTDSSRFIISKKVYTLEDGLASQEVFCGLQDDDGFMWFGTRNGLNRFDGKQFILFTKQRIHLAQNKIIQLAKDRNQHLFLVYGNPGVALSAMGVGVMNLKTNQVNTLKETFPNLPFNEQYVYWITNAGDDVAFLVSKPFQYWKLSGGKFTLQCEMKTWDNKYNNPENLVTSKGAHHTTNGIQCLFTKTHAVLVNPEENRLEYYFVTPDNLFNSTKLKNIGVVAVTPDKKLLLDSMNHFFSIQSNGKRDTTKTTFHPPTHVRIPSIYYWQDHEQHVLAYTETDGLFLHDFKHWYTLLRPHELKVNSGNSIYGLFTDRQKNHWIFTAIGLYKIKVEPNPFVHYFTKPQLQLSTDNQARGIFAEGGIVYANIWDKLYKKSSDRYECCLTQAGLFYGMCKHDGKIYLGSKNLYEYNEGNRSIRKYMLPAENNDIWAIDSYDSNQLLLGTKSGIYTFHTSTGKCQKIQSKSENIPEPNLVYRLLPNRNNQRWAIAQNGLYRIENNLLVDYFGQANNGRNESLPFDVLHDAYESSNGIFWFATNGEGLYRWDRINHTFQQFSIPDGLPSTILYRIEPDDYQHLWISTDNGLVRFSTVNYTAQSYKTANGISHNEFNRASSFRSKEGRLFFGGLGGVNAFYPKDFLADSSAQIIPMHIISYFKFSARENRFSDKTAELLRDKKIILQPQERFFNLEFQLMDFVEGKLNYAYTIENQDKGWNFINDNSIRVSGLPYGNYTLRIKGQAHDGQWSQQELVIPIQVLSPLYRKWWFLLGANAVLISLILFFFRWRNKILRQTKEALERTVSERTEKLKQSLDEKEVLLKEIHHRVKNNLQVISALLELQGARTQDQKIKAAITESQNRVLSIAFIHQNLYQHDDIQQVEVNSFVHELGKHIHRVFSLPDCEITIQHQIPITFLDIDTAIPLGLIINELLTNSYKYAFVNRKTGLITITMNPVGDGEFLLQYTDNGIGLPKDLDINQSNTLGLRLMRQLSKQLAGTMHYTFAEGSTFEFTLKDKVSRSGI